MFSILDVHRNPGNVSAVKICKYAIAADLKYRVGPTYPQSVQSCSVLVTANYVRYLKLKLLSFHGLFSYFISAWFIYILKIAKNMKVLE